MSGVSNEKKNELIEYFYKEIHTKYLYNGGASQIGQVWASKLLESKLSKNIPKRVLEIGGVVENISYMLGIHRLKLIYQLICATSRF
jgi:hypothetical protein